MSLREEVSKLASMLRKWIEIFQKSLSQAHELQKKSTELTLENSKRLTDHDTHLEEMYVRIYALEDAVKTIRGKVSAEQPKG